MNEEFRTVLDKACGDEYDLFEKAFDETPPRHNFSSRHKRRMNELFKNCGDPVTAREKFEKKTFWSGFGAKQAAAAAAVLVVGSGLILGGVKAVDMVSALSDVNKRYDELLKDGNYYLSGDSSVYFKAENGAITLCGDREKVRELFMNDEELVEAHREDPEFVREWAEYSCDYYMSEMQFAIVEMSEEYPADENGGIVPQTSMKYGFILNVDRCTDPWEAYVFLFDDRSLMFDGKNTIRLKPLGNFVFGE